VTIRGFEVGGAALRGRPSTSSFGEGVSSHGNYYAIGLVQLSPPNGRVIAIPNVVLRASRLSCCHFDVIFEPENKRGIPQLEEKNKDGTEEQTVSQMRSFVVKMLAIHNALFQLEKGSFNP